MIDLNIARVYREILAGVAAPRVLICGSRDFAQRHLGLMDVEIDSLPASTTVIHGGAPGADRWAGAFAKRRGLPVVVYVADWSGLGVSMVVAFWNGASTGTKDMITNARVLGIPVRVVGI